MAALSRESSPYYPPRARWYSPALRPWDGLLRRLALDRLILGSGITTGGLLLALCVPGFGFYLRSPGLIGKGALLGAALLLINFVLFPVSVVGNFYRGDLVGQPRSSPRPVEKFEIRSI